MDELRSAAGEKARLDQVVFGLQHQEAELRDLKAALTKAGIEATPAAVATFAAAAKATEEQLATARGVVERLDGELVATKTAAEKAGAEAAQVLERTRQEACAALTAKQAELDKAQADAKAALDAVQSELAATKTALADTQAALATAKEHIETLRGTNLRLADLAVELGRQRDVLLHGTDEEKAELTATLLSMPEGLPSWVEEETADTEEAEEPAATEAPAAEAAPAPAAAPTA
jgi:chromosome segregation ATPase